MKILISAYACNPASGSEAAVGWRAVLSIAKIHEVWVLTHSSNKDAIESPSVVVPENVHFIYHGEIFRWCPNRLVARIQSWWEYLKWLSGTHEIAAGLDRAIGFDICHHVTFLSWRVANPLIRLDIPFIWGPVGGGECFPWKLAGQLSLGSRCFEVFRELSNFISRISKSVRECGRNANSVFAANEETAKSLQKIGVPSSRIHILSGIYFDSDAIAKFGYQVKSSCSAGSPLRLFAGGNLEGRKGIALALLALQKAKAAGVSFKYTLGGNGSEREHLKSLARTLNIDDEVEFSDGLSGADYAKTLWDTDIFLLPSLRDSASTTLMEAMLCEAVPIVLKCGGPAEIVDSSSGIIVKPQSVDHVVEAIANSLIYFERNRDVLRSWGKLNRERILSRYSEENYLRQISSAYNGARFIN